MSIHWGGVDISKGWFDVFVSGREARFSNDSLGFEDLQSWLGDGDFQVVVEATGGHERALRKFLNELGVPTSVANATQVHAFGRAVGKLHKTDKVDARLLAEFGRMRVPVPSHLDKEHRRELRRLVAAWKSLQGQLLALASQLRSPEMPELARKGLAAARKGLEMAMSDVMSGIESLVSCQADLRQDMELLRSIIGVAKKSGVQILAQLPEGELRSARELAAYAGTAPGHRVSGSSVRGASRIPQSSSSNSSVYVRIGGSPPLPSPSRLWRSSCCARQEQKASDCGGHAQTVPCDPRRFNDPNALFWRKTMSRGLTF